jgi:hypothetical protein
LQEGLRTIGDTEVLTMNKAEASIYLNKKYDCGHLILLYNFIKETGDTTDARIFDTSCDVEGYYYDTGLNYLIQTIPGTLNIITQ